MQLPGDGPKDYAFDHSLPPGPFRHSLTVGWGDADPAQIAYTGKIPVWGLSAIEAWMKACLGVGWYEMNLDLGVGTPFVDLSCRFHAPITPRNDLVLEVTVAKIGGASLSLKVEGHQAPAGHCFSGDFTCVFVDAVRMKPIPIPDKMRANIRRFAANQGASFEDKRKARRSSR